MRSIKKSPTPTSRETLNTARSSSPWSHLGVDIITDLPESDGYTCVLVIVNRFSKGCRPIPLRGLPTAIHTAELFFNQVFRYFGIPKDIVSDRGPQFISRVWRRFFRLIGVTVSLSYHPQTNGQTERKIQAIRRFLCSYFLSWSPGLLKPGPGLGRNMPRIHDDNQLPGSLLSSAC